MPPQDIPVVKVLTTEQTVMVWTCL